MSDTPHDVPIAAAISVSIRDHIAAIVHDEAGNTIASGEDVVHALIDALAATIAKSPYTQTIRDRRLYIDEIRTALAEQVVAYQEAATKVVPLILPPHLVRVAGGEVSDVSGRLPGGDAA